MMKKMILGVSAFVLLLSACGGDDGDDGASEQEQEVIAALRSQGGDSGGAAPMDELSDEEVSCIAKGIVADDTLLESILADVEFEDLTVEQQVDAFGMMVDCAGDTLAGVMADGMMEDSGLSEDQARCFADGVIDDRDLMVGLLQAGSGGEPDADLIQAMFGLFDECGVSLSDLG